MEFKDRRELIKHLKILNLKVGVEVGVSWGYFSKFILVNTDMKLYSVDPWEDNQELSNSGKAYTNTVNLLKEFGDRSVMIKGYSPEVTNQFEDESIDFVYIDGLHTYDAVKDDLNGWYSKIRSGGIIAGHDYSIIDWEEVYNAVNEFISEKNIILYNTGVSNIKPENHPKSEDYDGNQPSWWFYKK